MNLGADPPIGSENGKLRGTNLYAGTGDPCAGQDRLRGSSETRSIVRVFVSKVNFGGEPPTGSKKKFFS